MADVPKSSTELIVSLLTTGELIVTAPASLRVIVPELADTPGSYRQQQLAVSKRIVLIVPDVTESVCEAPWVALLKVAVSPLTGTALVLQLLPVVHGCVPVPPFQVALAATATMGRPNATAAANQPNKKCLTPKR